MFVILNSLSCHYLLFNRHDRILSNRKRNVKFKNNLRRRNHASDHGPMVRRMLQFNVPVKGGLATSLHDRTARRWSEEGCTDMDDPPPGSDRWTDNLMGYCIITPYAKSGIHVHLPWSCLWRSQYIGAVLPCNQLQASTFPDRIILHHWARSTLYWLNTNELLVNCESKMYRI